MKKTSKKKNKSISKKQVAALMHSCFSNAKELYEEALLLRKNKKYARAFYLCIASLEELAKVPLVLNALIIPREDQKAWNGFWKSFKSHKFKQNVWTYYGKTAYKMLGGKKLYTEYISDRIRINELKLHSLYVDYVGGQIIIPNEIIKKNTKLVSEIFKITKVRINSFSKLHATHSYSEFFVKLFEMFSKNFEIQKNGKNLKDLVIQALSN